MRATHPLEFIKLTATEPPLFLQMFDVWISRAAGWLSSLPTMQPPTHLLLVYVAGLGLSCVSSILSEVLALPSVADTSQTWHHTVSHAPFNTFKLFKSKCSALVLTAFLHQLTQSMLSPITCLPTPDTWLSLLCAHCSPLLEQPFRVPLRVNPCSLRVSRVFYKGSIF